MNDEVLCVGTGTARRSPSPSPRVQQPARPAALRAPVRFYHPLAAAASESKELQYFIHALKHGFTTYNWLALTLLAAGRHLSPQSQTLGHGRTLVTCTTLGIAASFSAAWAVDRTSFPRIAVRLGITLSAFYVANFVVHLLPCALVLAWERPAASRLHGLGAAAVHLGWGIWRSRGTLCLDDIYVPLPRSIWLTLWAVAVVTELGVPAAL